MATGEKLQKSFKLVAYPDHVDAEHFEWILGSPSLRIQTFLDWFVQNVHANQSMAVCFTLEQQKRIEQLQQSHQYMRGKLLKEAIQSLDPEQEPVIVLKPTIVQQTRLDDEIEQLERRLRRIQYQTSKVDKMIQKKQIEETSQIESFSQERMLQMQHFFQAALAGTSSAAKEFLDRESFFQHNIKDIESIEVAWISKLNRMLNKSTSTPQKEPMDPSFHLFYSSGCGSDMKLRESRATVYHEYKNELSRLEQASYLSRIERLDADVNLGKVTTELEHRQIQDTIARKYSLMADTSREEKHHELEREIERARAEFHNLSNETLPGLYKKVAELDTATILLQDHVSSVPWQLECDKQQLFEMVEVHGTRYKRLQHVLEQERLILTSFQEIRDMCRRVKQQIEASRMRVDGYCIDFSPSAHPVLEAIQTRLQTTNHTILSRIDRMREEQPTLIGIQKQLTTERFEMIEKHVKVSSSSRHAIASKTQTRQRLHDAQTCVEYVEKGASLLLQEIQLEVK